MNPRLLIVIFMFVFILSPKSTIADEYYINIGYPAITREGPASENRIIKIDEKMNYEMYFLETYYLESMAEGYYEEIPEKTLIARGDWNTCKQSPERCKDIISLIDELMDSGEEFPKNFNHFKPGEMVKIITVVRKSSEGVNAFSYFSYYGILHTCPEFNSEQKKLITKLDDSLENHGGKPINHTRLENKEALKFAELFYSVTQEYENEYICNNAFYQIAFISITTYKAFGIIKPDIFLNKTVYALEPSFIMDVRNSDEVMKLYFYWDNNAPLYKYIIGNRMSKLYNHLGNSADVGEDIRIFKLMYYNGDETRRNAIKESLSMSFINSNPELKEMNTFYKYIDELEGR